MKKLFLKIDAILLGAGLVIGSGAAIAAHRESIKAAHAAKGDLVSNETIVLANGSATTAESNNAISWTAANGKIAIMQHRGSGNSGTYFTAVNTSYISNPRAYRGNYFSFIASDEFMIKDVVMTYDGNNYGTGLVCGTSVDSSASMTTPTGNPSTATAVTKAYGVVSDTTNISTSKDTENHKWTVTITKTGGLSELYVQNYDNNESVEKTQLRITAITISYYEGNSVLIPDSVTVSGETELTAGAVEQFTSVAKKSGSSTNVGQGVTWSSSNEEIVKVSSTGKVIGINNGNANVIATSELDNTISGYLAVTVSGAASDASPKTFSAQALGFNTNSYAAWNGLHVANGFVIETNQVAQQQSDYIKDGVVQVYEKYGFIFQKTNGWIKTATVQEQNINKVIISGVSTTAPTLDVKGGATYGATTSTAEISSNGMIHTYTFSSPVKYVTISEKGTAAAYINSFTLEFVGGADTASSLADFILGLVPNRDDVTGLCEGATGNYQVAKARYVAATSTVRSDFETGTAENIVSARTRYLQWAAVYGDSTPFADTISTQSVLKITQETNLTLIITVISIVMVLSLAGTFFIVRKRKHQ